MRSLSAKGELIKFVLEFLDNKIFNCSESIERYRKIIQQRIVAVREEGNRKYGNLLESIPVRLEQIVQQKDDEVVGENKEN